MKIIGLTGGIGSGKSTIAKMFEGFGVPIFYSDVEAKKLMNNSLELRMKLINEFGEQTFLKNELNRAYLANLVFDNKDKLLKLNAIVHPEVKNSFKIWLQNQNTPYVIQEHPLLFENNNEKEFDAIITVTAPLNIRIKRIMSRDKSTVAKIQARIENQLDEEYKIKNSDFVIQNIDLAKSKMQVSLIHKGLLD